MNAPELYIISDLHLCDGGPLEDFRPEDERALVAFLFRISRLPAATLIINGDFIDFVQIQPRPQMWYNATLGSTEDESLEKLELAVRAHAPIFDALRRFVAHGHSLRFHAGNHDIDLLWPRIQTRLRHLIGGQETAAVSFGTEYRHAGLYVEHGHQADPPNRFADQPRVIFHDPEGVPRLERCWGTRLVEEFYNNIEALEGCEMLDNVRPRMQAAFIVIRHALRNRHMHTTLYKGVQLIMEALRGLRTEADLTHAAEQLGVNRRMLGWIASVAGWLSVGPLGKVAKSATPALEVPSLQSAYAYGARIRDGEQLAQLAPVFTDGSEWQASPRASLSAKSAFHAAAQRELESLETQRCLERAGTIAARHREVRAICFGHTHLPITARLRIDDQDGWPIADQTARYFNSGSWTRTLDLHEVPPEQATFAYLTDPANYRAGRDYLRVTWPDDRWTPRVETLSWDATRSA